MSVRFVAEVSSNHGRDLGRCMEFIGVAARIGCAAVKFQQFKIRELFDPIALKHHPHLLEREAWELPSAFNAQLSAQAKRSGIAYSSTPFYLDAVEELEPYVDFYKLASYQILWTDMLREVARTGREVVLATGMATLEEVRGAVEVLRNGDCGPLTLLHCVSLYPTPVEVANLRAIESLRAEFGTQELHYGWSDHTVSAEVVERAVGRFGASMVEFHLDLDGRGEEYSAGHCWLPAMMEQVILNTQERPGQHAHPNERACDGDGQKTPRPSESIERQWRTDPSDGLRPLLPTREAMQAEASARRSA